MNPAKIRLSQTEMELVNNADLILTKNAVLKKVNQLLGSLQAKQQQFLALHAAGLPEKVSGSSAKISKGENYQGLPYLILDYPRFFEQENIFAVRTMFWWGNFFSITLHLSGKYKKQYENNILSSFSDLKKLGFSVCINNEEWEHHFEETNYLPVTKNHTADFKKSITKNSFIKLAKKIDLQNVEKIPVILVESFRNITDMLLN